MRTVTSEQLDDRDRRAIAEARQALPRAYAPYSRFRVACALVQRDGTSVLGVNVENASFGLSMCAERAAVFQAIQDGRTSTELLVVVSETPTPATPCGACRQVLSEFHRDLRILLVGTTTIQECQLSELLPFAFEDWRDGEKE